MSFHFSVFNYGEAFQMVGPKIFTFIQYVYKMAYHAFTNDIQNTISDINSLVHKISHVQKK